MYKYLFGLLVLLSCGSKTEETVSSDPVSLPTLQSSKLDYDTTVWKEITEHHGVLLDLKYATKDNFIGESIYKCPRCFLKKEAAEKLIHLQNKMSSRYGLAFIIYDCYRPMSAQQILWNKYPNPSYVTSPDKGSMHNRGIAVDIGIVDSSGNIWDMGSPFDHFGKEAHSDNGALPDKVIKNRKALNRMMQMIGFKGIRTEWWHFSDRTLKSEVSNWQWNCK